MSYQYVLTGVVHPERADVNVPPVEARAIGPASHLNGLLRFSIVRSQLAATYTSDAPLGNAEDLRYWAEGAVRTIVDTLGFTNGCGYDVEIVQFKDLQDGRHRVFGIEDPIIASLKLSERLPPARVAELLVPPFALYVQRSFGDLREAIRNPSDSGLFCYRAIECLLQYFIAAHSITDKSAAWKLLREELNVAEDDLKQISAASKPVRHGEPTSVDFAARAEIMRKTWAVVEAFTHYALRKLHPEG